MFFKMCEYYLSNFIDFYHDITLLSISVVLTLAGVRPLTLLSQHVKQSTLSTHSALEWLPALVTLIINQLENNAWTFAKHLSPMV